MVVSGEDLNAKWRAAIADANGSPPEPTDNVDGLVAAWQERRQEGRKQRAEEGRA